MDQQHYRHSVLGIIDINDINNAFSESESL
jgi:hypothetical protein